MAKIALRVYQREIDALIEQGQAGEAVAHCMHILKVFPKYLEAYRLLGKAFLELGRNDDAADIFKRLLLAVPDDFMAHIGMAVIFDERNDVDSALWHMERAFEVQPANAAVQKELRRLYALQRGTEMPKIRMTRGALARMYIKGELYQQGIAELQAILAESPERYDLQVLLALAWFQAQQPIKAAEAASEVLKQYPYCLDANRIMTEIASSEVEQQKTQFYRRRVIELDPYAAFVKDSVFESDQVPDAAVSLERLEYDESMGVPVADWQTGVDLIQEGDSDGGAWVRELDAREQAAAAAPQPEPEPEPEPVAQPTAEEDIPDFLKAAGWKPFSGEGTEEPVDFDDLTDEPATAEEDALAEALAPGELPDWLKEVAPEEVLTEAASVAEETEEEAENVDEWLSALDAAAGGALSAAEAAPAAEAESSAAAMDDLPDWLQELETAQPDAEADAAQSVAAEDLPDWLQELEIPDNEPVSAAAEAPAAEPPAAEAPVAEPPTAEAAPSPGEMPDDPEAAMKWLEALAARQGAKEEELVLSTAEERAEAELPDWLAEAEAEAKAPVTEPPAAELPDEMPEDPEEARKWLQAVAAQDGAMAARQTETTDEPVPAAEVSEPATAEEESLPDWLADMQAADEGQAQPVAVASVSESAPAQSDATEEALPDWLQGVHDSDENDTVATWLEDVVGESEMAQMAGQAEKAAEEAIDESLNEVEPVRPEDWQPLEETADEPKPQQRPRGTGLLSRPAGDDAFDPMLLSAQTELQRGNLNTAMDIYTQLIKKGRLLDEVIFDLREALYRYPVDVIVWQTLGDAYMRANRLQDALDAYTKAEELLR